MQRTYAIIGASAAGISCAQTLRRLDAHARIVIFSREAELPYNKCLLADYVMGEKTEESLCIFPHALRGDLCELLLNAEVIRIQPSEREIEYNAHGENHKLLYDALFIGTGSHPIVPVSLSSKSSEHLKTHGVFTFHTLADVHAIMRWIKEKKMQKKQSSKVCAVVVGAGFTGLECADALLSFGISVVLVDRAPHVLSAHINAQGARFIENAFCKSPISFLPSTTICALNYYADGTVSSVQTQDGRSIPADLVIFTLGTRPTTNLAREARLSLGNRGGILVDEYMRTSDPYIYAGGDAVEMMDQRTGKIISSKIWPSAMNHGLIAAYAMHNIPKKYQEITTILRSSFFGMHCSTGGIVLDAPSHWRVCEQENQDYYCMIRLEDDRIRGFIAIGTSFPGLIHVQRALMKNEPFDDTIIFQVP